MNFKCFLLLCISSVQISSYVCKNTMEKGENCPIPLLKLVKSIDVKEETCLHIFDLENRNILNCLLFVDK